MNLRPVEWLFAWLQERPVINATARLCRATHPLFILGTLEPAQGPLHVDIELEIYKRRGGKVSLFDLRAEVNGQALEPVTMFRPIEVEAGASPVTVGVPLGLRGGSDLQATNGDVVELSFRATHRRAPIRANATIR